MYTSAIINRVVLYKAVTTLSIIPFLSSNNGTCTRQHTTACSRTECTCCNIVVMLCTACIYAGGIIEYAELAPACYTQEIQGSDSTAHSQSTCFFLGPATSWLDALHTIFFVVEPVTSFLKAVALSTTFPDMTLTRTNSLSFASTVQYRGFRSNVHSL